jgi:hypothetical protein
MSGAALVSSIQWVALLGSLLTAAKLYWSGLYRRYRVFFAYFLFRVPNALVPLLVKHDSPVYFYVWILTEPLIWMFYIWVVLELCGLVLERHGGLYTLGKWAMSLGMTVSVTISVLSVLAKFKAATPQQSVVTLNTSLIWYFYAADRGVTFCLAIFLLLMLLLLSRYPVRLSRNVVLHTTLYTIYFLSSTLGMMLATIFGPHRFDTIGTGLMAVSALCIVAWFVFLNPKGEEVRVNIPHFTPENEHRILFHLDSLNSTLLKAARQEIIRN